MNNEELKGIYSALMASFNEDGTINKKGLIEVIRHNIDKMKVDGLYVGGSTGENFMLSTDEKKEIFRIVKEEVRDTVKLIAQVGSINVMESVELAKYCTELGYDALSAVTPFYYKFSFEEIREYYETILRHVDNKMIIYSIPFLTGTNISEVQFGELFQNEKIIGVKFTAADFFLLERIRKAFPDKLIFAGFDEMLLPATVLGVDGAIGSTYNINGVRARQIFELAKDGKIEEARMVQHETNDLITELLESGIYPTLKAVLEEMDVKIGYNRRPMASANEKQKETAKKIYNKYFN